MLDHLKKWERAIDACKEPKKESQEKKKVVIDPFISRVEKENRHINSFFESDLYTIGLNLLSVAGKEIDIGYDESQYVLKTYCLGGNGVFLKVVMNNKEERRTLRFGDNLALAFASRFKENEKMSFTKFIVGELDKIANSCLK